MPAAIPALRTIALALAAAVSIDPPQESTTSDAVPPARSASPAAFFSEPARVERVFDDSYPLEFSVSFAAGLFHWVDSLAGTSGGKTIPQYQREYYRNFGSLNDDGKAALRAFREARVRQIERQGGTRRANTTLGIFLEAADVEAALRALASEAPPEDVAAIRGSLAHFAPQYREVWRDGAVARAFVEQARGDRGRRDLERLLARMARFFAVDPTHPPIPRIVLVPVPSGGGTHAEAVGRTLLIEIRDWETLLDESPPIVHENAHFLWYRMDETRLERLAKAARAASGGEFEWRVLHEALPTALGQGVAARRFLRADWSLRDTWYHTDDVDESAKRIYPLVQRAIDDGSVLDEALVNRLVRAARGEAEAPIPR